MQLEQMGTFELVSAAKRHGITITTAMRGDRTVPVSFAHNSDLGLTGCGIVDRLVTMGLAHRSQ